MSSGRIAMRDIAKEWLKDPEFRAEYEALEPEFALASALIEARSRAGSPPARQRASHLRTVRSLTPKSAATLVAGCF